MSKEFLKCKEKIKKLINEEKRLKFKLKEIEETKIEILKILIGVEYDRKFNV